MASLEGLAQSTIKSATKTWRTITATVSQSGTNNERRLLDMAPRDDNGQLIGVAREFLAGDITAATADTNIVAVTQAGIYEYYIYNPSDVTMYVNFGTDPSTGHQIVLEPGMGDKGQFKTSKGNMKYKSSAANGQLIYRLRG